MTHTNIHNKHTEGSEKENESKSESETKADCALKLISITKPSLCSEWFHF